jgi:hypothetical protein
MLIAFENKVVAASERTEALTSIEIVSREKHRTKCLRQGFSILPTLCMLKAKRNLDNYRVPPIAVIMHTMLKTGELFNRSAGTAT